MRKTILSRGFRMTGPGTLVEAAWELPPPGPGEATIQVAGCGVCHTDLGFLYDGVPTRKAPPLVLGHEISGTVIAAGDGAEEWLGRRVIVPAVSPCGACAPCREGRGTSCAKGVMPGNDVDGGFATHVNVSARTLCHVIDPDADLVELSVVADAVSTPMQAIRRSGLRPGDLAVFVGVGGIGGFGLQIAAALGAVPVAVDVDRIKLERSLACGAKAALDAATGPKTIKASLRGIAAEYGASGDGWKIYECSGTPQGQELAFSLIPRGGVLSVVGFTPATVNLRLSNLMALDATAYGTWGADPSVYPEALALCTSGQVQIAPFVERHPLARAPDVLASLHEGRHTRRAILVP